MARKLRVFLKDVPQHIILKSIDSLVLFQDDKDYETFLSILLNLKENQQIQINAYALMPTYFQFLLSPENEEAIPKFMQSLGRQYVAYYNKKYNRTGTLWEGRYKASLIEKNLYLFEVMSYIEKLPLKQNLVSNLKAYKYTSIHQNLFNKKDKIITFHKLYKDLGYTDEQRTKTYAKYFQEEKNYEFIKSCLEKQNIAASKKFIENLEKIVGFSLNNKKRGRPKKQNEGNKKMFKNLQVLDKEKHKDLKIKPLEDLNFAKHLTNIPVTVSEASKVAQYFPLVFISNKDNHSLATIVSLGSDTNLAINKEGKWITNYIPSFVRKYPFSIASVKDKPEQKVIMIDEDSPCISKSTGRQLFNKNEEQSEVLENTVKFLKENFQQMEITKKMVEEIEKSGILEEREIAVGEGEEKKVLVKGFKVIDKEKLHALSDDILASWLRRGISIFIDIHLNSLDNINNLFTIANNRQ